MSCFTWQIEIHGKDCPQPFSRLKYKIITNRDTYEVDSIEEVLQVVKQDLEEIQK